MLFLVSTGCAQGEWMAADWGDADGFHRSGQTSGSQSSTDDGEAADEEDESEGTASLPGPDDAIPEGSGNSSPTGGTTEPDETDSNGPDTSSDEGESSEEPEMPGPVEKSLALGEVELVAALSEDQKQLVIRYRVRSGEVDGESTKMEDFELDELAIEVPSILHRGKDASSEYEKLCVGPGEPMFYLPQDVASAQELKSPSLSWSNSIHRSLLAGERVYVQVLKVERLGGGQSDFSVWTPGDTPKFAYSSCASDSKDYGIRIRGGFRSNFNLGFAGVPGYWRVDLEAYARMARSRRPRRKNFSLYFKVG